MARTDAADRPDDPDDLLSSRWYTVDQIAIAFQITPRTVRDWIADGLPALKFNSRRGGYRVRREDLNAWLLDRYQRGIVYDQRIGALVDRGGIEGDRIVALDQLPD